MKNFIIQFIGIVAYVILGISYFQKAKKDILLVQMFCTITFAIHYYLLNGITGTVCNLISLLIIITIYFFEKYDNKNKKILILVTIPLLILISLLTYENIFSIFPIIASTVILLSFVFSDEKTIRIMGIISSLCWLIYSIIHESYSGMFLGSALIIITFIALLKNIKKTRKRIN